MELIVEKNGIKAELKGIRYGKEWNKNAFRNGIKRNDIRNKMES